MSEQRVAETAKDSAGPARLDQTQGGALVSGPEALIVEVEGYEGPLDLLLALARTQKVDISRISMLALAEQYLAFIAEAGKLRLEIAADYLVMAAWLAYLKSRLLLPRETETGGETVSAEEMARRLAFRLARLDAMRKAAERLMARRRLGVDVFPRGLPEGMKTIRQTEYTAEVYGLLKAYGEARRRSAVVLHVVKARKVWSIKDARRRLEELIGGWDGGWLAIDEFLKRYLLASADGKTVLASSFGASLEMAREGMIELRQETAFGPLFMRRRGGEWKRI